VREACVIGLDDRRLGQVPVAALVGRTGQATPPDEELRQFLRARLLPYQIPVQFKFIPEMPRTPSLKPSQPAVRELFEGAGK
jgi:acyl-coenzyme A synthetase/AMP-(fatty) acid ligase